MYMCMNIGDIFLKYFVVHIYMYTAVFIGTLTHSTFIQTIPIIYVYKVGV